MLTRADVERLVEEQLSKIRDQSLIGRGREFLVSPYPIERGWDYSGLDERYTSN